MKRALRLLAGFLAIVPAACSPAGLVNLVVPRAGYHIVRDLAYGADPRQKLDLYIPDRHAGSASVLLFFYGGAWDSGNKSDYLAFGQAFASQGMIVAIADYRLYPQIRFPAFVADAAQALVYLHAQIGRHGGDPARIFIAGHSAGAYNAMMLAADPHYVRDAGGEPDWIRGVIGIAGPYDFLPLIDPKLITIFGGDNRAQTQPITHVDGKRPPMLLAAGAADTTVSPRNSINLAAKLKSFDSPVETRIYPGVGHIGIILSLAPGFRGLTPLRQDMLDFVAAH